MVSSDQDNSLQVLDLATNACHWLEAVGLCTVLQVAIAWYEGDLQKRWASDPEASFEMLAEIREMLESYLLRHPDVAQEAYSIVSAGSSTESPGPQKLRATQTHQPSPPREASTATEETRPSAAKARPSTSLDALRLSKNVSLALETQGIRTVEQLMVMSEEAIRNLGSPSVRLREEIRSKLRAFLDSPSSPWTSLQVLDLSVRAKRALMRAGFRTVEHLAAVPESAIWDVPNIGEKSLNEIRAKLEAYCTEFPDKCQSPAEGIWNEGSTAPVKDDSSPLEVANPQLSSEYSGSPVHAPVEALGLSDSVSKVLRSAGCYTALDVAMIVQGGLLRNRRHLDAEAWADIGTQLDAFFAQHPLFVRPAPLKELGLSVRSYNALLRYGVFSVDGLSRLSDEELWNIRGIGAGSVAEIYEKLTSYLKIHPEHVRLNSVLLEGEPTAVSSPSLPPPPPPPETVADRDQLAESRTKGIPLDEIGVERLGLLPIYENALLKNKIRTIGELAQEPRGKWSHRAEISHQLERYLAWLMEQDSTVLSSEVANLGISPLLRMKLAEASLENLVRKGFKMLRSREQQILSWRYGLDGDTLTLQEAGERLDVTRERVRQIQKRALTELRRNHVIFRPLKVFLLHLIAQAGGLIDERQVEMALHDELVVGNIDPVGVARLVFDITDAVKWQTNLRAWGVVSLPLHELEEVQKLLINILGEEGAPLPLDELFSRFKATHFYKNWRDPVSDNVIRACLEVAAEVSIDERGLCSLVKWEGRRPD